MDYDELFGSEEQLDAERNLHRITTDDEVDISNNPEEGLDNTLSDEALVVSPSAEPDLDLEADEKKEL